MISSNYKTIIQYKFFLYKSIEANNVYKIVTIVFNKNFFHIICIYCFKIIFILKAIVINNLYIGLV